MLAEAAWDVASRPFPWPPQSLRELAALAVSLRPQSLCAAPFLLHTIADLAPHAHPLFKTFLDAQLLISAQTTSTRANALYGSAALDLPRRGVNYVRGGIGALAKTLVDWIHANGGEVLFRQRVERIEVNNGRALRAHTQKGQRVEFDALAANLTPWALQRLLGNDAPAALRRETRARSETWSAFTLYLGLEAAALPARAVDHHQVIADPMLLLGEGNSVFISLSDARDSSRAPAGRRAATLSTHTALGPWWAAHAAGEAAYGARKAEYAERLLATAERAVPGLRQAVRLCLAGTPLTFETFTGRTLGMVGGFPQTSLFNARGPRTGLAHLWLVGDSIFPGQSTAGVTLGAMRVAADIACQAGAPQRLPIRLLH